MKRVSYLVPIALMIILAGCNLPSPVRVETPSPETVYTQAAETVAAELTRVALNASPTSTTTLEPTITFTPSPTNTTASTPTNTPIPCNLGTWDPATIDVTVTDYTVMVPNQLFAKTWRIQNVGSCSWNSSYLLIFDHGDNLGIPAGYTQQLTTGVVNPNQEVDLTVNMKAPATQGTYTAYWRMKDPGGVPFGITPSGGTFAVRIVVSAPPTSVTLYPAAPGSESGTIRSDAGPFPDFTIGESNVDITKITQAFLSYNISGIPAGATIVDVKTDFHDYTIMGNPFGLGVLNAYVANYGPTLDITDFVSTYPSGNIADWGSTSALNNIESSTLLKNSLQSSLGTSRFQLRLQFPGSNLDAVKDRLTLTNPALIVIYTAP
jgi:hypothetical protein